MPEDVQQKMNKAVGVWAKRHNIRPADFHKKMGWSYNHAWRILNGTDNFTPDAYGTLITAYGIQAMQEVFQIAGVNPDGVQEDTNRR